MATITNTGIVNSFGNTPQAKDDLFTAALTGITEDSTGTTGTFILDVMGNDLGGKGKTLWSLDNGDQAGPRPSDLLAQDAIGAVQWSARGAEIRITTDGKVSYTMTTASTTSFQSLGAGEFGTDTFTYAIRLGNGTLSWATATVQIMGTNDAPVAMADVNSGNEDTTISGTVAANDSDVDNGAVLTYGLNTPVAGLTINSDGSYSFNAGNAAYQSLAQGATQKVVANYTVTDQYQATSTSTLTITLTGTNDAPVAMADVNSGKEDSTISGTVAANDSDVDNGAVLTYGLNTPVAGLTIDSDGSYSFDAGNAAYQSLAKDAKLDVVANYTVTDQHGASSTSKLTVTLTGTNDAPVITSAAQAGAVKEDTTLTAAGRLVATDVDNGAVLAWTLAGGAPGAGVNYVFSGVNYTFKADQLDITKNGDASWFNDDFNNNNPPPSGDFFPDGSSGTYSTSGTFSEAGGRLIMDDSGAGPTFAHLFTSIPYLGHYATLRTDISSDMTKGLKSDDDFTVAARFDLIAPDENGEAYGIRLSDFIPSGPSANPGDDVMELMVRRGDDGQVRVQFFERDFAAGTVTPYAAMLLNAPVGAGQIELTLSHQAANAGVVTASFNYLANGVVVGSYTFGVTGRIFGTETPGVTSDDEVWTQAQIIAYSPGEVTASSINGVYGTLAINQNGEWNYNLNNSSPLVQALAQGQTATDTFTATVLDEHGARDARTITVTVTGTNDVPTAVADSNALTVTTLASVAHTNTVNWVDWTSSDAGHVYGTINLGGGQTIGVTYTGEIYFAQTNGGTDYYTGPAGTYTSSAVANRPTGSDIIALSQATQKTLTFSQPVNDLFFAVVSLNGNGYMFDQDFNILSYGQGYWGTGIATKEVLADGRTKVVGNGELHGVLGVTGAVQSLTWTSVSPETWNGFTVGTYGRALTATATGNVLANDTDVDATNVLTVSAVNGKAIVGNSMTMTLASGAVVKVNKDGTYLYDENSAFSALGQGTTTVDSFQYTVSDGHGGTSTATNSITITGVNDAAVITGTRTASLTETNAAQSTGGTLSATDVDSSNAFAVQTDVAGSSGYGKFTINAAGVWTYTMNNAQDQFVGGTNYTDSITVATADGTTQIITVTITGADEAVLVVVANPTTLTTGDQNDFDNGPFPDGATVGVPDENDTINGNTGNSTIYGGGNNDNIRGDGGHNTIGGNDTIYGGSGQDNIRGDLGDDMIYGGSGKDNIRGEEGNDVIIGGYGDDKLHGGTGADTFRFLSVLDTGDDINDFSISPGDKLDFSAIALITGSSATLSNTVTAHSVNYFQSGLDTIVWADTDGNTSTVELQITLTGFTASLLTSANFIL